MLVKEVLKGKDSKGHGWWGWWHTATPFDGGHGWGRGGEHQWRGVCLSQQVQARLVVVAKAEA